ncbi:MAG: DUF2071 domain-containing protein [Blastocatellia bacterium]
MQQSSRFLTAEWRWLAMLNYEVSPSVLIPYLPRGTEPDTWQGRYFVSLVGFLFLDTRVLGLPIPFHRNFEELNLRFYVRHHSAEGWRRGVVFIREVVPRQAVAAVARVVYNENYVALPMRHRIDLKGQELSENGGVEYAWRFRGEWNHLKVRTCGAPFYPAAGSEEEFITEHYWGYAAQRDGGCVEYQVEHPQWRVWRAAQAQLECRVSEMYAPEFAEPLNHPPTSAFVAEGSPVIVRRGRRLQPTATRVSSNRSDSPASG